MQLFILALLALVLLGADTPSPLPVALPTLDQLVNASPSVLLALGFLGFLRGWLVPGYLYDRAELRASGALNAAEKAVDTTASSIAAVSALTAEHVEERRQWDDELEDLKRVIEGLRRPPPRAGA